MRGGRGKGNGTLRYTASVLAGGVGRGLPGAFTGLFQLGRGFGALFVESCGRGGYWFRLCFWFWFWVRLGLHRQWQRIAWTVNFR